MEKMRFETKNITDENIQKILELFPNVATEAIGDNGELKTAIDFEKLKQELSEVVIDGEESYDFTWVGKKEAMVEANRPIRKTLRPDRESSVDWENTQNIYIEGDNLEALKLLQESYLGKVKMIYIDPPYNTGKDFVYRDNFTQDKDSYEEELGINDETGNRLFQNTELNGRFHSDWCSMIYPRLKLARNLLTDDGVIFISIDDNEVNNLRKICDDIFGEQNCLGIFVINSTPNARDYGHIGKMHEFVLFYAKNSHSTTTNLLPDEDKTFKYYDEIGGYNIHPLYNSNEAFTPQNRPNLYYPFYLYLDKKINNDFFEIGLEKKANSIEIYPPKSLKNNIQFVWRWGKEKALNNLNKEIIGYKVAENEYRIVQKMRHSEKLIRSLLLDKSYTSRRGTAELEELFNEKLFSFPKPIQLICDFIKVATNEEDIILDFFSGSATTAHSCLKLNTEDDLNRKFICIQLPETVNNDKFKNLCEIGKERIKRAGKKIQSENPDKKMDIGFRVFKVDDTNMNDVYYTPSELHQTQLGLLESNIKSDRTDEDLLYGCLLDWGVELSLPHKVEIIDGKRVHIVDNDALIACFEKEVPETVMRKIAEMKPTRVVFKDGSFVGDANKINVEEIFKLISPETTVKVI